MVRRLNEAPYPLPMHTEYGAWGGRQDRVRAGTGPAHVYEFQMKVYNDQCDAGEFIVFFSLITVLIPCYPK
jgi:hypothetical protein